MSKDLQASSTLTGIVTAIWKGYAKVAKKAAMGIGAMLLLAAVSIVTVYPLWYLATTYRRLYTFVVLGIMAAAVGTVVILQYRSGGYSPQAIKRKIRRIAVRVIIFLGITASAYGIAVLFTISPVIAIPCGIVLLLLVGYLLYGRKHA